jgi:hypothetical protein
MLNKTKSLKDTVINREIFLVLGHNNHTYPIGKEVKPSIATVCVCALLLHVEHYNMFRPVWAIFR